MSASLSSTQERSFQARNNVRATLTALLAIISRNLLVMRREALTFLVQMLVQPLFFLFVFGKVLPTIGAASAGFSTLLLPGIVAFTVFIMMLQGPSVELARDLGFTREIEDQLLAPLPIALVAVEKILLSALRGLIAGAFVFPLAFWILGQRISGAHRFAWRLDRPDGAGGAGGRGTRIAVGGPWRPSNCFL